MIAPLAKFLDWLAIQHVALRESADAFRRNSRLEESLQFLKNPEFIPADSQPAQVECNGRRGFHFPTPRPSEYTENDIVHGWFYRCGERWQERPVIILLHGSGDGLCYNVRFPAIARRCNRLGLNAAALMAPYNLQRRPRKMGGARSYADCVQFVQATAQALAEVRAFTGWLLAQGCPAVALWGYSQGAWYAGMAACCDARLAAVVLGSPPGRQNPWVERRALRPQVRRRLMGARERCDALNLTPLNLSVTRPVISPKNILLLEGTHELICPMDDIEDLWQSWGQPDIWRLPHGHVGICCGLAPGLTGRILRWLLPRLEAGRKKAVL